MAAKADNARAATSTSSASTRSGRSRSTRSRRRTRAIPGRRWRWRPSPTCSGSASCASTPPTRSGPTATASCSRTGTPRCCSTRCSTWPASRRSIPTTRWSAIPSVSLDDIKRFRQLDSQCPGHPEYRWTSGVETTTGPLGQGIATSVGMAIASKWQAARFNRDGFELFDFDVYAIAGDGCLMEGVSHEAASIAGHQKPRQPLLDLRQQPHHDRRPHRASPTRTTSRPASRATAGTSTRVGDANDLELLTKAFEAFQRGAEPPDADHRRLPHRLRLAAQGRHRRGARRAARARRRCARPRRPTAGPRTPSSSSPTGSPSTSPRGSASAGAELRRGVGAALRRLPTGRARARRTSSRRCSGASCPRAGTPRSRASTPTRRGWRPARPRTRSRTRSPRKVPWLLAGSADLTGSTSVGLEGDERLRARRPRRPPAPPRDPRARVGGALQRALDLEAAPALVHLPHLLRLRASPRSASPR